MIKVGLWPGRVSTSAFTNRDTRPYSFSDLPKVKPGSTQYCWNLEALLLSSLYGGVAWAGAVWVRGTGVVRGTGIRGEKGVRAECWGGR